MAKIILLRKTVQSLDGDPIEMIDAADLGCVYDDPDATVRANNKFYLWQGIEDIKAASTYGGGIMISGPETAVGPAGNQVQKRVGGVLHVDVDPNSTAGLLSGTAAARGPIKFPLDGSGNVVPFVLAGLPGSVLYGRNVSESGNIPGHVIEIDSTTGQAAHDPENINMQLIQQLSIRSQSRGIWIKRGGRMCILNNVHMYVTGLLSDTPFSASTTWTEWHDWSSFQSRLDSDNVPYAIRIDNSDGVQLIDCTMKDCETHGLIITRLHDGHIDLRSSENKGCAMAADVLRGTRVNLRAESNGSYAMLVNQGAENEFVRIWPENNRRWNSNTTHSFLGNKHRMVNLGPGCQSSTYKVHACNRHNLFRMNEGTRLSNMFQDIEWIDPSRTATVDATDVTTSALDTGVVNANKNYGTVWTNGTFRPSMTLSVNDIVLSIPTGAFNTANIADQQTSFLFPFADASFPSVAVGDVVIWSCEVEFDAAAVTFCKNAESNRGTNLTLANPLFIKLLHANDPAISKELEQAHANIHVWNSGSVDARKRKFAGRKQIFSGGSTTFPNLSIGTWTDGLDDAGPAGTIVITIRNLTMWHLPKDE